MPASSFRRRLRRALVAVLVSFVLAAEAPAQGPPVRNLQTPPGFTVSIFAAGLRGPRWMSFGPDGNLYVSLPREGRVVMLPDRDRDGRADDVIVIVEGVSGAHGLAWLRDSLWVSTSTHVLKLRFQAGDERARGYDVIVGGLTDGSGHSTRTLLFDPGGRHLYVAVGSSCNICEERDRRRAAIVRYNVDGSGETIYARGLRNVVGLEFHPATGTLWATQNERDWLGDDLPLEELNIIQQGGDYGWPYCYGTRIPNPEYGDARRCADTIPPALTFQAHSAPLGMTFYTAAQFPEEYRGDAFIAFHGSWNRSQPTGYKVVHVEVKDGKPVSSHDFVAGWLTSEGSVWGRPVDVKVGPEGALYISDDQGGRIWRVTYAEAS